jgi:hypothetical protein
MFDLVQTKQTQSMGLCSPMRLACAVDGEGQGVLTDNPGQVPVQAKNNLFNKKTFDHIYERHQMLIGELEIGAVGIDFSRRTSWRVGEDLGRA